MSPILQAKANGSAFGYGMFVPAGAGGAFESIASATGTGSSSTITFSSIPSTYQSLHIRGICKSTDTGSQYSEFYITFNGAATNFRAHQLYGDGNAAFAVAPTYTTVIHPGWVFTDGNTSPTNNMSPILIDIEDYKSTTKNKTVRVVSALENNNSSSGGINNHQICLASGLWVDTSAINSVSIRCAAGSWTTTTQFALYGIKGA